MKVSRPTWTVNRALVGAAVTALALGCSGGSGAPTAIEIPIARIQITQPCSVIVEGGQCQIGARAFTEDGRQIANPVLRYVSTNSTAADVSIRGLVTGRAAGSATIFVTNSTGSVSSQFVVNVFPSGGGK
jgi:hypothetical protein